MAVDFAQEKKFQDLPKYMEEGNFPAGNQILVTGGLAQTLKAGKGDKIVIATFGAVREQYAFLHGFHFRNNQLSGGRIKPEDIPDSPGKRAKAAGYGRFGYRTTVAFQG